MMHPRLPPMPSSGTDVRDLTQRLLAGGADHLAVDCLVGHSAIATVFTARDTRRGRRVTLQLVDSDSAYDIGGAAFVRGIGSAEELGDPHILPPGRGMRARGAVYYVGPYAVAESLADYLARSGPLPFGDALLLLADVARALDRWHTLGLAHGDISPEIVLIHGGRALLTPPNRFTDGWDARERDDRALARVGLALLERSTEQPVDDARWQCLRKALRVAADQPGAPLSARRLAAKFTALAELQIERHAPTEAGPFRRVIARVAHWARRQRLCT